MIIVGLRVAVMLRQQRVRIKPATRVLDRAAIGIQQFRTNHADVIIVQWRKEARQKIGARLQIRVDQRHNIGVRCRNARIATTGKAQISCRLKNVQCQ